MRPDALLLVGWNRGIRQALRRVARRSAEERLHVAVLVPPDAAVPAVDEIDAAAAADAGSSPVDLEAQARVLLGGREPRAVIAMAERTVLTAAQLRAGLGLPGLGVDVALRCADKIAMKRAANAAGIPTAAWREVDADTAADDLVNDLGLPLVIKPARDSGGRGQQRCDTAEDVAAMLASVREAPATGGSAAEPTGWLAEGWVGGTEMSVETFVRDGEPCFASPTMYLVPRHANVLPAALPPDAWEEIRAFAARGVAAMGIERGITHLELFRGDAGLVFGEVAARPPGGRLMQLIERAWSFDPWDAVLHLELGLPFVFPERATRVAGTWILHPGAGVLRAIDGLQTARDVPGVRRIALKVAPEKEGPRALTERVGSGQDIGAIYADGPDVDAVATSLRAAHDMLRYRWQER